MAESVRDYLLTQYSADRSISVEDVKSGDAACATLTSTFPEWNEKWDKRLGQVQKVFRFVGKLVAVAAVAFGKPFALGITSALLIFLGDAENGSLFKEAYNELRKHF